MSHSIGEEKSQNLLAFHASFAHYGKKPAWEAWGTVDDTMAAFQALSSAPMADVVDKVMPILEQ